MTVNGTYAPWSRRRPVSWWTGSPSGIIAATRAASADESAARTASGSSAREAVEVVGQRHGRVRGTDREGITSQWADTTRIAEGLGQVGTELGELRDPSLIVDGRGRRGSGRRPVGAVWWGLSYDT